MKKRICFTLLIALLAISTQAQKRIINIKVKIIEPTNFTQVNTPSKVPCKVRVYHQRLDTIFTTDSIGLYFTSKLNNSTTKFSNSLFILPFTKRMVEGDSTDFMVLVPIKDTVSLNDFRLDLLGQLKNRKTKDIEPETVQENYDNYSGVTLRTQYVKTSIANTLFSNNILLYPVPAQGVLNIKVPQPLIGSHSTYTVYNMQGKVVFTYTPLTNSNNIETINLETLANGNYVVVLNSYGTRYSQVFSVQR